MSDTEWRDFEKFDMLGVMNSDDMSFIFYGAKTYRFDVLQTGNLRVDKDGDEYYMMQLLDDEGDKVSGKLLLYKGTSRRQLYLMYPNHSFCYEIRSVEATTIDLTASNPTREPSVRCRC